MLIVDANNLNLWSRRKVTQRALTNVGVVLFYTAVPIIVLTKSVILGVLVSSVPVLVAAILTLRRNKIIRKVAAGKPFDPIYRLQTRAERTSKLTIVSTVCMGLLFVYLVTISLEYGFLTILAIGVIAWFSIVSELFDTLFQERVFAKLCLRNYLAIDDAYLHRLHTEQIARGLGKLEKVLSQSGFVVPHFELTFAVNVARLSTSDRQKLREGIGNLADVLENSENVATVSRALGSSRELLANVKEFTDVGIRPSYPLRRRLLSSRTLENARTLVMILSTAGPMVIYLLRLLGLLK